jgi:hypothetical protein
LFFGKPLQTLQEVFVKPIQRFQSLTHFLEPQFISLAISIEPAKFQSSKKLAQKLSDASIRNHRPPQFSRKPQMENPFCTDNRLRNLPDCAIVNFLDMAFLDLSMLSLPKKYLYVTLRN